MNYGNGYVHTPSPEEIEAQRQARKEHLTQVLALCDNQEFHQSIATRGNLPLDQAIRFVRLFQSSLKNNKLLLLCSVSSLRLAAEELAAANLSPSPSDGQCYLIPFKRSNGQYDCTFMTGWRGEAIKATRRNGLKSLTADVVYKGEPFRCLKGAKHTIEHELKLDIPRTKENIYAFYAVAVYPDGTQIIEVMSVDEVEKIRQRHSNNKPKNGKKEAKLDGWRDSYAQMGRKTVIKRLAKMLTREKDGWVKVEQEASTTEINDVEEAEEGEIYEEGDACFDGVATHTDDSEYEIVNQDVIDEETIDEETGEIIAPNEEAVSSQVFQEPLAQPIKEKPLPKKPRAERPVFNSGDIRRDVVCAYSRASQDKLISFKEMKLFMDKQGVKDLNHATDEALESELDRLNELFAGMYCEE